MLTSKYIEQAKILQKRKVNIASVQETRWAGSKSKNADRFKLWYFGRVKGRNGVAILVDRELRESVVEVRRVNDRLMAIKLVVGGSTMNVVSAYAPQAGLGEEVIGWGIWRGARWLRLWDRNVGGTSLLDFARAFELVIVNSSFSKREEHLVTFKSMVAKSQIDYIPLRMCDREVCEDCKVILSETLATQNRLLVMDVGVMIKKKKRFVQGQPMIRWGDLPKDTAHELEGRLLAMGAWKSIRDASAMWMATTNCIREAS
uniref:Craniofacial development protein 2-like n=1 Tax=Nicotiana tabacum TaxID=4097 RepID=A0A1S3XT46_TOBAC|nr:PREDICTED: craniofacial development protein 2-like [Nicotiana tabacum]